MANIFFLDGDELESGAECLSSTWQSSCVIYWALYLVDERQFLVSVPCSVWHTYIFFLSSCLPKSRTLFNKAINPQKVVFLNRSHWADSKITHTGHEDKLLKKLQPNKNFLRIIVPQSEPEFIDQTNNLLILYVKIYKVVNGKNWLKFRNFCLFSMDMLAKRPFLPDWSINSGGQ